MPGDRIGGLLVNGFYGGEADISAPCSRGRSIPLDSSNLACRSRRPPCRTGRAGPTKSSATGFASCAAPSAPICPRCFEREGRAYRLPQERRAGATTGPRVTRAPGKEPCPHDPVAWEGHPGSFSWCSEPPIEARLIRDVATIRSGPARALTCVNARRKREGRAAAALKRGFPPGDAECLRTCPRTRWSRADECDGGARDRKERGALSGTEPSPTLRVAESLRAWEVKMQQGFVAARSRAPAIQEPKQTWH
jgi:hypothetical protein